MDYEGTNTQPHGAVPPLPWENPKPVFRPADTRAVLFQIMMALFLAVAGLGLVARVMAWVLQTGKAATESYSVINRVFENVDQLTLGLLGGQLIVGIFFIVWMHRAYGNVPALEGTRRYGTGWAIGAWFVPFLNLVRPKQITDDLWKGSDPDFWPQPSTPLLHWWWGLYIAASLSSNGTDPETYGIVDIVSIALLTTSGVLLFIAVGRITVRQSLRAVALAAQGRPPVTENFDLYSTLEPPNHRVRSVLVGLLPVVSMAFASIGFGLWTLDFDPPPPEPTAEGVPVNPVGRTQTINRVHWSEAEAGDCLNVPGGPEAEEVWDMIRLPCTQPHDMEIIDSFEVDVSGPYPGLDDLLNHYVIPCRTSYELRTGLSASSASVFIASLVPTEEGWEMGDRSVICYAEALGQTLDEPLPANDGPGRRPLESLKKGDCVVSSSDYDTVSVVPCSSDHDAEVHVVKVLDGPPGSEYPGEDFVTTAANNICPFSLGVDWFGPDEYSWGYGDRVIMCYKLVDSGFYEEPNPNA